MDYGSSSTKEVISHENALNMNNSYLEDMCSMNQQNLSQNNNNNSTTENSFSSLIFKKLTRNSKSSGTFSLVR